MPTREDAWKLVTQYVESESLRRHMLCVEAAMRAYARKYNQDEDLWGLAGLLHDFDYERWPNEAHDQTGHPFPGIKILQANGYPDEIIQAILGHADYSGVPRTSQMAKALYAVDELCGFVMAVAYVRPEKLAGMSPSSVRKKLKDKRFAAAVNREDIQRGMSELLVDPDAHMQLVIDALTSITDQLGLA